MKGRTSTEGFAARTRRNLEFVEQSCAEGAYVHEVTQIALSLLGLVVIPFSRHDLDPVIKKMALTDLRGWPDWSITPGLSETNTLFDIVHHLRNAAAHGRVSFSNNERDPKNVDITFKDVDNDGTVIWRADIRADGLREFCSRLFDLIEPRE
jgi:hypothetical protein